MRNLSCPNCRERIFFEQVRCMRCAQHLAFDPTALAILKLDGEGVCSNRDPIGCNWLAEKNGRYCRSCALTRTIPNLDSPRNLLLWRRVEQAKRRLVYDLCRLHLPVVSDGGTQLRFDILSDAAGGPVLAAGC